MKKLIIPILSVSLLFTAACKKEEGPSDPGYTVQNDQTGTTEADNALEDVNDIISNSPKLGNGSARTAAYDLPCGVVSVDSSTSTGGHTIYKLNYGSSTPCGYKYKSGQVSFHLTNGNTFAEAGAVFSVTFTNYKVEVRATGSEVTLNGTIHVTNVNGHYIWEILNNQTITHTLRGALNITYDNGVTRIRRYFQKRVWDSSDNTWLGISLTIDGDSIPASSTEHISETGYTYDGNYEFRTVITTPLKWSNCNATTTTADDWRGPYVLKNGDATLHAVIPGVTPTTIQVEAGYYTDMSNTSTTPVEMNDCMSNTYKITTTIGTNVTTQYQLY